MGKWGRESRAKLVHHPLHEKMKQAFFDRFVLVLSYSKYYTKNLVSVIIAETYFLIQRLWKKFFFGEMSGKKIEHYWFGKSSCLGNCSPDSPSKVKFRQKLDFCFL